MTGCEVITKSGTKCALIKVRHSGGDMVDLLKKNPPNWANSPEQILKGYKEGG